MEKVHNLQRMAQSTSPVWQVVHHHAQGTGLKTKYILRYVLKSNHQCSLLPNLFNVQSLAPTTKITSPDFSTPADWFLKGTFPK
jgi:hypothetical protein